MINTIQHAQEILHLSVGASKDEILQSYKKLAVRWHPDKNKRSEESYEIFSQLCCAFKILHFSELSYLEKRLNETEMFSIFEEVFLSYNVMSDSSSVSEYSSEEKDDESLNDDYINETMLHLHGIFCEKASHIRLHSNSPKITPEEAERNAETLMEEEEKEKRRIEKRKAKKKRRRQKKKLEKEVSQTNNVPDKMTNVNSSPQDTDINKRQSSDVKSESEEELDPTCAFVANVASKNKMNAVIRTKPEKSSDSQATYKSLPQSVSCNETQVLQSRKLAIRANQMASTGNFAASIQLFTEAIRINPIDYRFYGNRSYCYDREGQFDKALKDAEKAISINNEWPKNFFRKGRALVGLKRFEEAEQAFQQALKLDPTCKDAEQELFNVRIERIVELGFTRQQAITGIQTYGNFDAALEALISKVSANKISDTYMMNELEPQFKNRPTILHMANDIKMDPSNPEGYHTIWIGNIAAEMKWTDIQQLFTPFGTIESIRHLPDKFCAFINFKEKTSAGNAMKTMQGYAFGPSKLLIRFPDKVQTETKKMFSSNKASGAMVASKLGPVNGGECYFWRQGNCIHGANCKFKHLQAHKGIDRHLQNLL